MEKAVTIKEVAARANVSVGTVSRVLAKNSSVKVPLVERVNQVITELGYKPNFAARALRVRHVNVIGLLIPDITNPFFAQLADKIEELATGRGFALIVSSSRNDPHCEAKQFGALLEHQPKAIFLIPASDERLFDLPKATPVFALDRCSPGLNTFGTNQSDSAALALQHLVDLGHRNMVYISGPETTITGRQRKNGILAHAKTLFDQGMDITLDIKAGAFDFHSGEMIAREILSKPVRPTAILAANDQIAIGVIRTARDMRIDVPSELSVIGFDDIDLAALVVPRLTTIRQPVDDIASAAVAQIFSDKKVDIDHLLMGELIERQSTQAIG